MDDFYVYLHIRHDTNTPFYVGKGRKYRAFKKNNRSEHWNNISKFGYSIIFLEENLEESVSFQLETYWIRRIGRKDLGEGTLVNITDGGEKTGMKYSDESKEKMRQSQLGRRHTEETKKKISQSMTGRKYSKERGDKIRNKLKSRVMPEDQRQRLRDSQKGKKLTEQHRENIRLGGLKRWKDYRDKMDVDIKDDEIVS